MTSYVLLPGAGGSSWYWSRVAPLLRATGAEVLALDFPAADESAGLAEYAAIAADACRSIGIPVLVAQSLAGFTAPLVCAQVAVSELVLVNAMIPLAGETPGEWGEHTGSGEARTAAARAGGYDPEFDAQTYFFHDIEPAVVVEGEEHEQPESGASFASRCDFAAWPSSIRVLTGADDRLFPPEFQQRVAQERLATTPDVLPGGHLIALSRPVAVARYLLRY